MNLSTGKIFKAQKILIYGPEGIGKTTFASKFPGAVFIDTEGSTLHYDVTRFPYPVSSWQMLISDVQDAIKNKDQIQTLVIDTTDWAEHLCESSVLASHQIASIEDAGYGKGYTWIREEFGRLLNLLSDVTNAGINVVLTAHAQMRKFEQPDALGAYDRWELKLSKQVSPLVKEWADVILFADFKTYTVEVAKGSKANDKKLKATGSKRVMYATHHQCWDAKNRWGIADDIDEPAEFNYDLIKQFVEISDANQASEPAAKAEVPIARPEPKAEAPKTEPTKEIPSVDEDAAAARQAEIQTLKIPQALKDLMLKDDIVEFDLQNIVASRGFYPSDMRIESYPDDFINGWVIKYWDKVVNMAQEIKSQETIPFN